ncbi:MAG: diguanylate cyclase [Candidatus Subteraquimicrobiales bacterium]|nr:diguanylate cyclase [Candidatus Subteraquimicrobiales bacterium]
MVSPPVAQARAIKAKDREVKVVFIGPCIAMKNEVEKRELDAVLTFKELKEMFKVEEIDLAKIRILETKGEAQKRTSLFGGMPREELGRRNLLDTDIRVVRSVDEIDVLMEAIQKGEMKLKFIDALICNGCVAGSGMDTRLGLFVRKRVIERYFATNQIGKAEKELPPFLAIDLSRTFTNKKTVFKMPTEEELGEVFLLGKKKLPEDFLNCGACGYSSCEETAIAIFQKFADWQICHPYQKEIILDLVKKLKQTTITESLTGLLNSAGFRRAVEHEIRRSERYGSTFSLMIFDVDYFKLINDTYGHVKGDHLLSLIAQLLRKNLREVDISARLGGDEFGIILPEVAKTEGFAVAEKLREAIKNFTFKPNGKERVHITISCGVAAYSSPPKRLKAEELIQLADEAMYKSKRDGRNKSHLA